MGELGLRAGLYQRVSVLAKGADARAVDEQNQANENACERERWTVAECYADPGRSASRFARKHRDEYARCLTDLRAGRLDILVMWEPSRGSRELEEWARLLNVCRERAIGIYVTGHGRLYDLSNGRDWRSLAEDGVDSAYESEKTSARVSRALAANAAAGRPHGKVLFGYQRSYDPRSGRLTSQEPDPAARPIVAEVISRIAAGHPMTAIASDMTRRAVPSPAGGPWNAALVRRIATNEAYIGRRLFNGTRSPAIWAPLIDEATFWRAQRILTDPSRPQHRPGSARHLLSYLVTCKPCGGPLNVTSVRGTLMYICKDHHCTAVRQDWLDAFITGAAGSLLDDPEFWEHLTRAGDADVLAARAKADEMRADLREHLELVKAGRLTPASFAEIESALLARIAAEDQRALSLSVAPVLRNLVRAPGGVKKLFRNSPLAVRKQVLRELFSEISLLPATRHGKHGFDPDRVVVVLREQGGGDDPDSVRVEPVE